MDKHFEIAKALLETKAVHIEPNEQKYFTWTSGKRSPIYCDNRTLISYPEQRELIVKQFCNLISETYSDVQVIAGTATAGIPWASWIASELKLPMIYIRSKPKGHGLQTAIEGSVKKGSKTLIIEDLISTGKSSLNAVQMCKNDDLIVQAVLSIFSYSFDIAKEAFEKENIKYTCLCDLPQLLDFARESKLLSESEVEVVKEWI